MVHQELHQEMRQLQTLSPQMQQALYLLQLPIMQLQAQIQQELESNPVLEQAATEHERLEVEPGVMGEPEGDGASSEGQAEELDFREEFERLETMDRDWRDMMSQTQSFGGDPDEEERRAHMMESIVRSQGLQDFLLEQLRTSGCTDAEVEIGEYLIGDIDENGYWTGEVAQVAAELEVEPAAVEEMLVLVRSFDPPGVGGSDLRECLLLQLRRLEFTEDSLEIRMVRDHLEVLGKRQFRQLEKLLQADSREIQAAAELISQLDPKPGRRFDSGSDFYVVPEVVVEKVDGRWTVQVKNDHLPHLRISNLYRKLMQEQGENPEVVRYIRDKVRSGKLLIKALQERQSTIYRIAEEIVAQQEDFLEHGYQGLKGMRMAEVADRVGVHETTVSRAVNGKYMQTPRGIFEMRFFFNAGYNVGGEHSLANRAVKESIAEMVAKEDKAKPLSDQEIALRLKEQGIPIARRTIAKYRDELKILPSNLRRES